MVHFVRSLRLATLVAPTAGLMAVGAPIPALAASSATCNVASIVAQALPAIVNITVVKVPGADEGSDNESADVATDATGLHFETFVGSGSDIDSAGIIITNKHVIQDAATIRVTFDNKREVPAQLIAAASMMDLAVLKVNMPQPLLTLHFGDSDVIQIDKVVIAVANPLGLVTSVSVGVVSARYRDLMRTPFDDFIQTERRSALGIRAVRCWIVSAG